MLLLWLALLTAAPSFVANIDDSTFECRKRFENGKGWLISSELIRGARDDCFWTIQQKGAYSVEFTLLGLNVTASPNCSTDYLEVLDGESVLMRLCGTEPPQNSTVISQRNSLTVHLKSSSFHHSNSFNASYTKKCGATIYATETGLYHHQYLKYNCTWTVLARHPNQRILVDIYFLDRDTDGAYLDTWGVNSTSDRKRLQISSERRHVFLSLGEAMHFSLRTLWEDKYIGIVVATYTSGRHSCGRSLSMDMSQELDSSRYGPSDRCVWNINYTSTIHYDPPYLVQFTLGNLNIARTPDCSTDYLEVLDGPSLDGEVLKRVCGNELNTTVTSPSNVMAVRLKMNNIDHNNSYSGSYSKVCRRTPINVTDDSEFSHSGSNCSWTLVAKEGQNIWLDVGLHAEGSHENETSSFVDVWDGMDNTGKHLLRLIGDDQGEDEMRIVSHGPAVHISLVLIPSRPAQLTVQYHLRDYSCGAVFQLDAFTHSASLDSSNYNLSDNCAWSIRPSMRNAVQLTLADLNIAETPNCSADYLEVINSDGLGGKVSTRVCGSNLEGKTTFISQGTLTVRLKSSSTHHNNSFRLSYKAVCAAARTTFTSDYLLNFSPENCTWTLKANSSQEGILITGIEWRVLDSTVRDKECVNVTYVDIWEEVGSTWQYKGRYCKGRSMWSPISSGAGAALRVSLATPPNGTLVFFAMYYSALKWADSPRQTNTWTVPVACIFAVIAAAGMAYIYARVSREKRRSRTLFENGNIDNILPFNSFVEQAKYLPYDNIFEVRKAQLRMGKVIGMGVFGVVRKAEAYDIVPEEPVTTVAVKMLHGNRKNQATMDALASELKIMVHLGRHLNIVNLLGAHTADLKNVFLVLEYCKYGNLQNYLSEHRSDFVEVMCINTGVVEAAQDDHTKAELNCRTSDLFLFAFQVAQGMEFLTSRNVLHGDLAARNVLLSDDKVVKICDFGLSKILLHDQRKRQSKESLLLPVKWMAIEAIQEGKLTKESDVWSFGIFTWELFSLAESPYAEVHGEDLQEKLKAGYRMGKPCCANDEIYKVMTDCWQEQPLLRPDFTALVETLGSMIDDADRQLYAEKNKKYEAINRLRQQEPDYYDYLQLFTASYYNILPDPAAYANIRLPVETRCDSGETPLDDARRKGPGAAEQETRV